MNVALILAGGNGVVVVKPTKKRKKLVERSPFCHWCKKKVHFYIQENGQKMPASAATLDHYFAKGDERREDSQIPAVLSCFKCNQIRGNMRPENFKNELEISPKYGYPLNVIKPLTSKIYELIPVEIREKLNKI